ncbi:MAG: GMC family oxidoreductase [Myxococcota bacterium]|nr:GMC family oxidoreductase [Myxococcota bacterium]
MMNEQLILGKELDRSIELTADLCIVGSGAGGAVLAARAAEAGRRVVILEAGGLFRKDRFRMLESEAFTDLYQDRGARQTADKAITVLQGRTVGGGTTVNWTTCFRTPESVLDHWRAHHGLKAWTSDILSPHFEAVEKRLNIKQWPESLANENNRKLLKGGQALGWKVSSTSRNVLGCVNSGYCGMGCPVEAKQAMEPTYLTDALNSGAILITDCSVRKLVRKGTEITEAVGQIQHEASEATRPYQVRVRAKRFAVAGGSLNSPALLLASGIDSHGRVGRRTFLHPVIGVGGLYEDPVQGFYGAPQSLTSHQFAATKDGKMGFFFETAPVHPALSASVFAAFGSDLSQIMSSLDRTGVLIALHIDGFLPEDEGGTVRLVDGRPSLHYPVRPALKAAFQESHKKLAELTLAAGAYEAFSMHLHPERIRSKTDVSGLDKRAYGAFEHPIFSAHQMGGCAMGPDPATSVVDEQLKIHGLTNAYVVDGSVLPTSLGVNPSQTIYGIAHRASEWISSI